MKDAGASDVRLLSIEIDKVWPRNARYGNYSGILECEITATAILLKVSTGQQFRLQQFKNFVVYYGYDQKGDLVVQTPGGFQ
jgi:hypothetical protein